MTGAKASVDQQVLTANAAPVFPVADGVMAGQIRAYDWASTPLGPLKDWSSALRIIVDLMLASKFPQCLFWGEELIAIYNDAYIPLLGDKTNSLGVGYRETWPEVWDSMKPIVDKALAGQSTFIADHHLPLNRYGELEDAWFTFCYSPVRDENGVIAGIMDTVVETTEKVLAEQSLANDRKSFMQLFEQSPTFMGFLRGPHHRIDHTNPGYMQLIGHRDVIGKTIAEALPEAVGQGFVAMLDQVYATGEAITAHGARYDMQAEPGGPIVERYVDFVYQPIIEADGEVSGILVQGMDVTDRTKAQQAVIEARNAAEDANLAKSQFLANMSHEIRTPMNAIVGLSTILSTSRPLTDEQYELLRILKVSADSLMTLISDLLDLSKIEAQSVQLERIPFSLDRIIADIASVVAMPTRAKGLSFTCDTDAVDDRLFIGDPTRLRQIVLNLCTNAVKFTEDGSIHVAVTTAPLTSTMETVSIVVSDSGIGIPADKLDSIFHKFVQADTSINRKYGGTGLGLAITRNLAELMGGEIRVTSEAGIGSTFELRVPLEVADREAVAEMNDLFFTPAEDIPAEDGLKVLLVEDYEPNILVATTFLQRFGYQVDIAVHGGQAIEKTKHHNYRVVLMDVQMPGIDGLEATRQIRSREKAEGKARVPIIGITAHALAEDRERCLAAGMDDYLSKPFDPEDLRLRIEDLTK